MHGTAAGPQDGFTLLEFMLALLLGSLLVLAMLQAYLSAKSVLRWQYASSSLDVRASHALELLSRELRMSGFLGGVAADAVTVPDGAPGCTPGDRWALTPGVLYLAVAESLTPAGRMDCIPADSLQADSMLVGIRRAAGAATWGWASVWRGRDAQDTQWYLRATHDGTGQFHWAGEGVPRAPADTDVAVYWPFHAGIFYVRRYSVTRGDGIPTLCVERLMSNRMRSECLVEGIESLRVEVAIDSDGDGHPDRMTLQPAGGEQATHAHIFLLARSLQAPGAQRLFPEMALGARVFRVPDDGHLRRVYQATVPLFNHRPAA